VDSAEKDLFAAEFPGTPYTLNPKAGDSADKKSLAAQLQGQ
jgi:hypothetical protein